MANWIGVIGVVLGALVGAGIQEFRFWMERKQRYQVMTFEKRLQTHQEAYRLCMDAGLLVNELSTKGIEAAERFNKLHDEAKDWLKRNCLYLDTRSQEAFVNAFFAASIYGRDFAEQRPTIGKALEYAKSEVQKCLKFIAEGVGAKYLPEVKNEDKIETDQ